MMLLSPLLAHAYAAPSPYTMHVGASGDDMFRMCDVHVLASDPALLPVAGGAVDVTIINYSKPYLMKFGPMTASSFIGFERSVNLTITITPGGGQPNPKLVAHMLL